jgi:hypothetical protein
MFDRPTTRPRSRLGYGTLVIALAALFTAVSMFFASAADVNAMLRPDQAAARAMGPVEIPQEWVWRGRAPVSLDSMYANKKPIQQDWIRTHRSE